MGEPAPIALNAPQVTVYDVIVAPPSDAGGVNATVACALPALTTPIVGAPGTVALTVMVMEKSCDVLTGPAVPVTVPVNVPAAVGGPLRRPLPPSVSPGGSAPEVTA